MKQKIVMKVEVHCDKCRSKALKTAAETQGVSSVSLEGDDRDELVVTGEVDAVCLAKELRKKLRRVQLVSVEEVKKKSEDKKKETQGEKKETEGEKKPPCATYYVACQPPPCPTYFVAYEEYPTNCFMM